jgi:hypothetical protein
MSRKVGSWHMQFFINFSRVHNYANTLESGNTRTCEFQPHIQKFLVAFCNENLFMNATAKGHFSGYVRLPKNFSTTPSCDFCVAHRYRKINKCQRAVSCEAEEGVDSDSKVLLHLSDVSRLQPSLLGLRLMRLRAFRFWKNEPRGLSDFSGHFFVREGGPAGFCVVLGSRELGEGRWGDKTKTRHFSGSLGCVGSQHP